MKAEDLYDLSRNKRKKTSPKNPMGKDIDLGLDVRTINALLRAGYAIENNYYKGGLDTEKIKTDVLNGDIWLVRNIGIVSVMRICTWLINKGVMENKDA